MPNFRFGTILDYYMYSCFLNGWIAYAGRRGDVSEDMDSWAMWSFIWIGGAINIFFLVFIAVKHCINIASLPSLFCCPYVGPGVRASYTCVYPRVEVQIPLEIMAMERAFCVK